MTSHRLRIWMVRLLLAELLILSGYAMTIARAQEIPIASLQRQLSDMDKDLSGRVRVLESDMAEVKWLSRAVTAAVIGQLVMAGMGLRERKGRAS